MQFLIVKEIQDLPYWKRLTKETTKFTNITVDWEKYVDEDDEETEGGKGLSDWDQDKF